MRKVICLFSFFIVCAAQAQELNCTVTVNADKLGGTNTQVYKTLQKSLTDFINKTNWTSQKIKNNERINCSMFISINEAASNQFKASIQVQSSRTIFNSTYGSPILNYNDKDFNFEYSEFQNLTFNPNNFDSNLISVVAFYSLMIIGMDADTFTLDGGRPYYEQAQDIVSVAQSSGYKGWNQGDSTQNRYFLVNDLLSNTFSPYRDAMYQYHFEGMDVMHSDLKTGKEKLIDAISKLAEIQSNRPNAFLTRLFFDAKADEIVSIFTGGPAVNVADLLDKLYTISPLNASKWAEIKL